MSQRLGGGRNSGSHGPNSVVPQEMLGFHGTDNRQVAVQLGSEQLLCNVQMSVGGNDKNLAQNCESCARKSK